MREERLIDHSRLLLRTLEDLEKRISSEDPYELLGASVLIRKLFLDGNALVDQVNRVDHTRIRFLAIQEPIVPPGYPRPAMYFAQDGIDPEDPPPFSPPPAEMTRAQFFSMVVMSLGDKEYSIGDVIRFEANVMGGVHAGSPVDEKEKALAEISGFLSGGGYSPSLRQLKAVGRIIIRALQPLRERVQARLDGSTQV